MTIYPLNMSQSRLDGKSGGEKPTGHAELSGQVTQNANEVGKDLSQVGSGEGHEQVIDPAAWTTRKLLDWMNHAFVKKQIDSPRLCAEILLAHVLETERLKLYMHPNRIATDQELTRLRSLVGRALKDEPVQYLTEQAWFFALPLRVDRRVLVPRPCTEVIVEQVLQDWRSRENRPEVLNILELCTGSGCISIALAKNLRSATLQVLATDVSVDALDVARNNAREHGVDQLIAFVEHDVRGDLQQVTSGEKATYVLSNPPYIPDHEWIDVPANVKNFEPTIALRGGSDGLDLIRPILQQGPSVLESGGLMLIELAASHAQEVLNLAQQHPELADAQLIKDLEGHERVLRATKR